MKKHFKQRSASSGPSGNSCAHVHRGSVQNRLNIGESEYNENAKLSETKQNQAKAPRVPARQKKRPNVPSVVHILNCNKKELAINHIAGTDSHGTQK